jgi:hypothetical protein
LPHVPASATWSTCGARELRPPTASKSAEHALPVNARTMKPVRARRSVRRRRVLRRTIVGEALCSGRFTLPAARDAMRRVDLDPRVAG